MEELRTRSIRIERQVLGAIPLDPAEVTVGADAAGFLLERSNQEWLLGPLVETCGIGRSVECVRTRCNGHCSNAPVCACDGAGGCDVLSREWCEGECGGWLTCSNSVNDCRCGFFGFPWTGGVCPNGVTVFGRNTRNDDQ